ncbi:Nn.00g089860.m01.CDS01 [Neocucurbitaria sp. VM-36]
MRGSREYRHGRGYDNNSSNSNNNNNNNSALPSNTPRGPARGLPGPRGSAGGRAAPRGSGAFGGNTFGRQTARGQSHNNQMGNIPVGGHFGRDYGIGNVPTATGANRSQQHVLDYHPRVYYPPPDHVDQADLPAGVGFAHNDSICLNCGNPLHDGHRLRDGTCTRGCAHCGTSEHTGMRCPRLWLSKAFYKKHARGVPQNVQIRPTPMDCIELERLGHQFFRSVPSLVNKADEPRAEKSTSKRRKYNEVQDRISLPSYPHEAERLEEDGTRRNLRYEREMQSMRGELEEIKRQLALATEPQPAMQPKRKINPNAAHATEPLSNRPALALRIAQAREPIDTDSGLHEAGNAVHGHFVESANTDTGLQEAGDALHSQAGEESADTDSRLHEAGDAVHDQVVGESVETPIQEGGTEEDSVGATSPTTRAEGEGVHDIGVDIGEVMKRLFGRLHGYGHP